MKLHIGTTARGAEFYLPLELVTTSLAILAKKRVGKSYTAAVFAEELMLAGQPVCIIDITGAHWGLKAMADGKTAGFPVVIFGGRHADVPLEENAGAVVARAIVEQRFSSILDFSIMSKAAMKRFLTAFLEEFYRINQEPIHLICDEADRYAPQQPMGDEIKLVAAMDDIVSRGGIKGIGVSIISQRSAKVNKNIVTQCELLVALRIVHPLDAKTIMEWVEMHATKAEAAEMLESLPTLPVGTGWFWWPGEGSSNIFQRVRIRKRDTFDSGATPKAGESRQQPKVLAEIDVAKLGKDIAATVERAKADDPRLLRAEIGRLKTELARRQFPEDPIVKIEEKIIERPILSDSDRRLLQDVGQSVSEFKDVIKSLTNSVDCAAARVPIKHPRPAPIPPPKPAARFQTSRPIHSSTIVGVAMELPVGERKVLTACIQHPRGLLREQLTAFTSYKRSSRDAYISRLKEKGYVAIDGILVGATQEGITAFGAMVEPLPQGEALRDYYMQRLPEGERKILAVLCQEYPSPVSREALDAETNYKRSSRDAYIARLKAKELVVVNGEGITASHNLFDS